MKGNIKHYNLLHICTVTLYFIIFIIFQLNPVLLEHTTLATAVTAVLAHNYNLRQ